MGTPHVATHDRTCAGNPPVVDRKHAAGMSQQVEKRKGGGFHTSCQLLFCASLSGTTPSTALAKKEKRRDITASLAPASVLCF